MTSLKNFSNTKFIPVIVFFAGLLFCHFTGNRGVHPIDSFSHFDSGFRILNGEHPFRDYWIVSGFFVDYFQSLIFLLLGTNWQTYILNASLMNGFLSALVYYLFAKLGLGLKSSFFYSICFALLAYPSSGTPFVDHHSAFLSLISVIFLILAIKTKKSYFWFLIPFFLFLGFLSKQVPATYIFISVILVISFHLLQQTKKESFNIISVLFISSLFSIILLIVFLNSVSIDYKDFLTQYILYPSSIGNERYNSLNYNINNVFSNFKLIYLALIFLLYFTFNNLKKEFFYKSIDFKISLICILIFISLAQHIIVTKNQIFIFFLIPLFFGFAHLQFKNNQNSKNFFNYLLIIFCMLATIKYHLRFNVERKFHELNGVQFTSAVSSEKISKKLLGLKWISPRKNTKEEILLEVNQLNAYKNILLKDKSKKIVITNYSLFSVLLNENVSSYSRWFPGDNSAFPVKGNIYFDKFSDFISSSFIKRKINSIYLLPDVDERNLTDYINPNCLIKKKLDYKIIKFDIDINCKNLALK